MELGLKGKKAIITGGSRGIGLHTAILLAQEGCCIAFCARNQRDIDAAVEKIGEQGNGTVVGFQADLEDGDATRGFVSKAIQALSGVDILVHNASGFDMSGDEA